MKFSRDVANVATGPHPPVSILRERVARVALLIEASTRGVHVEFQQEVWGASACELPSVVSTLRLKSSLVRLQSCVAKQDPMGVATHDKVTFTCVGMITNARMPHRLIRDCFMGTSGRCRLGYVGGDAVSASPWSANVPSPPQTIGELALLTNDYFPKHVPTTHSSDSKLTLSGPRPSWLIVLGWHICNEKFVSPDGNCDDSRRGQRPALRAAASPLDTATLLHE